MVFVVATFSVLFFIVVSIRPALVFLSLLFLCEIIKFIRSIFSLENFLSVWIRIIFMTFWNESDEYIIHT